MFFFNTGVLKNERIYVQNEGTSQEKKKVVGVQKNGKCLYLGPFLGLMIITTWLMIDTIIA